MVMADPFNYDHTSSVGTDSTNTLRRRQTTTTMETEQEMTPPSLQEDNTLKQKNLFGFNAAITFFIIGPMLKSFMQTILLTFAYAPFLPFTLDSSSADIFCEIVGPFLGYLLAMKWIGGCYGKMFPSSTYSLHFLQIFALVFIAQVCLINDTFLI